MAAPMKEAIGKYCGGETQDAPKHLAAEINKNNAKFVELIENLGDYLTNTDTVVRGRATQLIGDVLDMLPPSFLSQEQVELVATFLLSKLSDHHSVQPHALQTLAVLTSRCNQLPSGLPERICQTIFREVQNQTLSHSDRRATYLIVQNLLGSSRKAIEQLGGDFVIGFIQQIDAEKDPRNLTICFSCAHFISSNFHLGPFAEEMFEVLACYFPIDFVPPPNDPHGITKEELIEGLRKCLAATPEFAQYCVPLLLEKMTSDLQSARMDAFLTLTACAPVYGKKGLSEFLGSVVSSIKREVLMNLSSELVDAARGAIKAVYSAMAPPQDVNTSRDDSITTSIVELYQDISKYLDGPDIKKSSLAYSLCQSVASTSPVAFCTVAPLVLPSLISCCSKDSQITEQLAYLKELKEFIALGQQFCTSADVTQAFGDHLPPLFTLYEGPLNKENRDLQIESMRALTLLTASKLSPSEKGELFVDILVKKSVNVSDPELRNVLLTSLRVVVQENPGLRPRTTESLLQLTKTTNSKHAAEALVYAVADVESFVKVCDFLLTTISQDLTTDNVQHIIDCTHTLSQLLTYMAEDKDCTSIVLDRTAMPLLRTAVTSTQHWTEETRDKNVAFMSCFRNVFRTIGSFLAKSDVITLWNRLQKLMLEGDVNSIDLSGDFKTLSPLKAESPWQQTRLVALLEGFVTAGDIQAMIENREAVFEAAFRLALESDDEYTHISACRCVAAIFNKAPIGSQIQWLLEPLVERLKTVLYTEGPLAHKLRALTQLVWMTKAMECRAHSATAILSSQLVSLLSDPDVGAMVAERIGLIVEDMDDIFTAKLKGNITPLYKQRFFTINLNALLDGYKKASAQDIKQNHLVAISHIMANLPLQVMKPHFAKLVPLLLLSLDQPSSASHSHTLNTLCSAVEHAPDVIVPNVDSLVSCLLELATADPAMKVRISALKCLESLTALPSHAIAPLQAQVVRKLANTLDDKKRLVRKQAVEARSAWILLENPEK